MAALYDLFRTPQPKGEEKVRYHARSVVTSKMSTQVTPLPVEMRSRKKNSHIQGICGHLSTFRCRGIME